MSKKIEFKEFSSYQLSQIKPCSLFLMEQIYDALVHNASMQGVDGAVPPSPKVIESSFVYVAGAGVECINGTYEKIKDKLYRKEAKYGEMDSVISMRRSKSRGWVFEVMPKGGTNLVPLVMYEEASSDYSESLDVPFGLWKVCEGKMPLPYVAVVESVGAM